MSDVIKFPQEQRNLEVFEFPDGSSVIIKGKTGSPAISVETAIFLLAAVQHKILSYMDNS